MEIIIVTLAVFMIQIVAYIIMDKEQKKKKQKQQERKKILYDFINKEIDSIEKLELAGIGSDANSDNEFILAVRKINLSNKTRIKLYE